MLDVTQYVHFALYSFFSAEGKGLCRPARSPLFRGLLAPNDNATHRRSSQVKALIQLKISIPIGKPQKVVTPKTEFGLFTHSSF
jgi:hypothetical protein